MLDTIYANCKGDDRNVVLLFISIEFGIRFFYGETI